MKHKSAVILFALVILILLSVTSTGFEGDWVATTVTSTTSAVGWDRQAASSMMRAMSKGAFFIRLLSPSGVSPCQRVLDGVL